MSAAHELGPGVSQVAEWLNRRLLWLFLAWLFTVAIQVYAVLHPETGNMLGLARISSALFLSLMFVVRAIAVDRAWLGSLGAAASTIYALLVAFDLGGKEMITQVAFYASLVTSLPVAWLLLFTDRVGPPRGHSHTVTPAEGDGEVGG